MKNLKQSKKRNLYLILSILMVAIILMGSAYAYFSYDQTRNAFVLKSGPVKTMFYSGTNRISYSNAYPTSDLAAINNLDKYSYLNFSVEDDLTKGEGAVYYELYLTPDENNTLDEDYIRVYLTDDKNEKIYGPVTFGDLPKTTYKESSNGKLLYSNTATSSFNKNYRIYVWIDEKYSQNISSETFNFKVNLYAYNINS